jgi:hypothetical protein
MAAAPVFAGISTYGTLADWTSVVSGISTVTIPDPGSYIYVGNGTASTTYSGVTFSQSGALSNGYFFVIGSGYGASPADISSQEQSSGVANILITLPSPVTAIAFNYGTFQGSGVNFALSNGDSTSLGSTGSGYATPDFFGITDTTAFDSVEVTSPDYVLNVSGVNYGDSAATPEPSFYGILGLGMGGLLLVARRMRSQRAESL